MTYLEIVNNILRRLRENEVDTVSANSYSKLIGMFVNDVKKELEHIWNWEVLRNTLTITTSPGLFNYVLTDAGTSFRILDILNDTSDVFMDERSSSWMDRAFLTGTTQQGIPQYYSLNGVDSSGDAQVDIYPIPDGVYDIRVNGIYPQADLVNNSDVPLVNANAIIYGVVARAIEERGDDGGYDVAEQRYRGYVSDLIAIEANRRQDEISWYSK